MPAAPQFQSEFLRTFAGRGACYDCSGPEELDQLFAKERVTAYIGFDCTADSLHVGSLVQLMTLRRLQQAGHKPILLMGADAILVDNAEWLDKLDYIPFLRDVGRHFSVNRMLTMESVKLRLEREQPLSFLEFNYSIMQAYDFVELHKRYGCRLQSSGSDQWGNVVSGIDLGHRLANVQLYGLTTPLITTASGAKMGKTAAGAVWLNAARVSPYDYWQFWRNTEDRDVGRFLRLFTDLPLDEIARLEALQGAELNEAKKILATAATAILHGKAHADQAADTARRAFEEGAASADLPTVNMVWDGGQNWTERSADALVKEAGLATSLSDARRKIAEGAVKINDALISDASQKFSKSMIDGELGAFKVQYGRKKIILVKPT